MAKTFAICTLGCKVNTYESEAVAEQFAEHGYIREEFSKVADVYIINTCTVTHLGDRKSRQMIRRTKQKNPNAVLVVMGCYSQVAPEAVSEIPEVDIVFGNDGKNHVFSAVETFLADREMKQKSYVTDIGAVKEFEHLTVTGFDDRTRAVLKVQDGCNNFCSYCIIPYARGRNRSNPMDVCLKDARALVKAGYSEIVLTGIHLGSYGKDTDGPYLIDLLEEMEQIEGIERIRLGSLEPTLFDSAFCTRLAKLTKICRHFHLSLQSGCDETLVRMNRKYNTADYAAAVDRIRAFFPEAAITTDIMTGFPGETEEEFEKTLAFAEQIAFSDAHIFQYSVRKGTRAETMKEQVSPDIKEARSRRLIALTTKTRDDFLKKQIGKTVTVLFERLHKETDGLYEGKTDNYITVLAESKEDVSGMSKSVRIDKIAGGLAWGEIVSETE